MTELKCTCNKHLFNSSQPYLPDGPGKENFKKKFYKLSRLGWDEINFEKNCFCLAPIAYFFAFNHNF
ncbi:hypothetical protein CVS44_10635 [Staphylococcus haemolyticus]|nr:hypothetical protein CVS44_10635 [Staphylococcus haemolyticus]